jgi:hypothetical protein
MRAWYPELSHPKDQIRSLTAAAPSTTGRRARFGMRDEQAAAVAATARYFRQHEDEKGRLRFLWNAKMRFGKTYAAYKLAEEMGWTRILVLTYKPAVQDAWESDLKNHEDFSDWGFIGNRDLFRGDTVPEKTVWMSSYQALFSRNADGDAPARLDLLFSTDWDAIFIDEYHYGAHRDQARDLTEEETPDPDGFETDLARIRSGHQLYLSGTPFRALASGEFTEDQIFHWTYTDEQRAKAAWDPARGPNPYAPLPQMIMMTYKLPDRIIAETEEGELDLDLFFAADVAPDADGAPVATFRNEAQVSLWLDFISGTGLAREELSEEERNRSPMPFKDKRLQAYLEHTFWYLPSVAACQAMAGLLRGHSAFRSYHPVVAAGPEAGIGIDALGPVRAAIEAHPRTITLSCGKLTTGVTVPEWSAVFMLRGMRSPESYFQTAFRAQSPRVLTDLADPGAPILLKDKCYLFDFDPRRALGHAAQYCHDLDRALAAGTGARPDIEARMAEFLDHLPVLCHINGVMDELDAGTAIDIVTSGTGTAMLARRFMSARMVRVNQLSMERMLADGELVNRLERIESFRNLSRDLTRITGELARVEREKREAEERGEKPKTAPKVDKETAKAMKDLQENLQKFIGRLPVFMYINDEREKTVLEVIDTTDDALFYKATGITKSDFRKLLELGVFDDSYLNDAIRAFKQVEDNALVYLGDREIRGAYVAAWNTHVDRVT